MTKTLMCGVALCLAAAWGSAEIVFKADFNGPFGGIGGAYDKVALGGSCAINADATGQIASRISKDSPLGNGGGYFSCVNTSNSFVQMDSVTFTPSSATNSLDAMTSVSSGDRVINGGFDFFFRSSVNVTNAEMRALDSDNRSNGGLRFTFGSVLSGTTRGIRLEVISPTGGLLVGGESGSASSSLNVVGAFSMASNTVYHLGVTFATDSNGTVTAKLWAQAGTGTIDLATASPIGTLTFGINESVVTNGFATGSFGFNQLRPVNVQVPMTLEYDQFRVYNATPTAFGALTDYAWRTTNPQTVLQADFKGTGGGTGGYADMVTVGGRGTLVDYGTVSDASVTNTNPFRTRSSGYLSILTTNNTVSGVYGRATITPLTASNSFASMSAIVNSQRLLRGGVDFFFRTNHSITNYNEFRPIDSDNRSAGGLRFILHTQAASQLELEMLSNAGGLYSGGEGGASVASLASDFAGALVSNTVYHVGISFDSTDAGTVTAAVWLKEGTGSINLHGELPIGMMTFGLNEAVVTNGFVVGSFDFGKLRNDGAVPSRQDYDGLRVFSDTPSVFGELPVPPFGTSVLIF